MNGRFNRIVEYLKKKKSDNFTGSVKLSFEGGNCVAINEANRHETPLTESHDTKIIEDYLNMAANPDFNGAVVFAFESGSVHGYSYSKTYKGETLKKFFGA